MGITLKDIAQEVGVSISTASRVLNKDSKTKFLDETKEKVWKAAQVLGYVPNESARKLATRSHTVQLKPKTGGIGYLLNATPERFSDPFFSKVIKGIDEALTDMGTRAAFSASCLDFDTRNELAHSLSNKVLEGLIVVGGIPDNVMEKLIETVDSVVWIGDSSLARHEGIDIVSIDYEAGIKLILDHITALRHRDLGFITGENKMETSRLDAYKKYMEGLGLTYRPESIQFADFSVKGGYQATIHLLDSGSTPTAVIAASDTMAIGSLKALRERGLSVPQDVSVVGFDDIDISAYIDPPLTTVRVFKEEIGKAAVKLMVERLNGERNIPYKLTLPVKLIARESTYNQDQPGKLDEEYEVKEAK